MPLLANVTHPRLLRRLQLLAKPVAHLIWRLCAGEQLQAAHKQTRGLAFADPKLNTEPENAW